MVYILVSDSLLLSAVLILPLSKDKFYSYLLIQVKCYLLSKTNLQPLLISIVMVNTLCYLHLQQSVITVCIILASLRKQLDYCLSRSTGRLCLCISSASPSTWHWNNECDIFIETSHSVSKAFAKSQDETQKLRKWQGKQLSKNLLNKHFFNWKNY